MAWILEYAKMKPGFLIGGVPQNFDVSARAGESPFFVIEADEYDSAFFDKRSKFVHYQPRTLVINNMEFDHADIFDSLADIQKQFHHLVRTVPSGGLILAPVSVPAVEETLEKGCWTPVEYVDVSAGARHASWRAELLSPDGSHFNVLFEGEVVGEVKWDLIGDHNVNNGLMAIAAARNVGVTPEVSVAALAQFKTPKRRMELKGEVNGIRVYDDFAHHPTAIKTTLEGLRNKVGDARIIAVLEPRSNTMRSEVHQHTLPTALNSADFVYLFEPENLKLSFEQVIEQSSAECVFFDDVDKIVEQVVEKASSNDHIVVMSNGGFGGIHQKLLERLESLR